LRHAADDIGSKEVFEAAQNGDEAAMKAIDQAVDKLALACVNISRLLDTELIVFAGGICFSFRSDLRST
jgi:glucokinase